MPTRYFLAALCALLAAVAPARAEPAKLEEAILALPAFSFAFSLEYLAEDLHLYEKHGVKIATRDIAGIGSINAVISGSIELALASGPSLTRAAARGSGGSASSNRWRARCRRSCCARNSRRRPASTPPRR